MSVRGVMEMARGAVCTVRAAEAYSRYELGLAAVETARAALWYARGGRLLEGRTGRLAPQRCRRRRVQKRIDARGGRLHYRRVKT
jgi:hypothetical protein